jgi:hypothetical protein
VSNQYKCDLVERLAHDMGPCLHVSGLGMPFLSYGGWVCNIDHMSLLTLFHVVDAFNILPSGLC